MSSRSASKVERSPRVRVSPKWSETHGDLAVMLSSGYGLVADEWQSGILDDWLAVRADGKWTSSRCGLSVPRQNGKNAALEIVELFKMVGLGRKILHTAHEVKTARKAFLRLCSFFENERQYPELFALVKDIRRTNGQEAILLTNGGGVEFIARSKGSGRGFTVDDLVMDEAQELDDFVYAALVPTISAAPSGNPQQIITGTPPGPKDQGEVFTRVRTDALSGKSSRTSWHEWSADTGDDFDDPTIWAAANPALGIRLGLETVADERAAMDDETFARERLGMWAGASGMAVIDAESWAQIADVSSLAIDRLALAVDVSPDRTVASVALAGQREDGRWHVELDEQRAGVGWLANYIVTRCERNNVRAVVIDQASAAASIIDDLMKRKINVTTTDSRKMAAACGQFYDGVMDQWLVHTDQPQVNYALSMARKRPLEASWAWNRKNAQSDITPLVAVTLALWGAQNSTVKKPLKRSSGRKAVVL